MKQLKDLKKEILNNEFNNFYVFYGEDFGLRKHYIDAIKKNYDRVVVLDDYVGISQNKGFSLIITKTLFIIYNCDSFCNLSTEQINGFIKKIQSDCVIFDFENARENSNLFKEFENYITYFPLVNDNIGSEFVRSEVDLILNNNRNLAFNCFNNYNTIKLESDKIKNYAEYKSISDEQAYEVLYNNQQLAKRYDEYNNDMLVNDLLIGNSNNLAYWDSLIKEKYSQEFWYNLSKTINDFLIAYLVQRYGKYPGSSKAYELGLPWNRAKVIRELSIPYDANTLLYYTAEIANTDYMIKVGKLRQEDLFNYIVYTIM